LADGCELVFEEKVSSREANRKALRDAFGYCRDGDVLVVARLDRLGRSLRELIDLVGGLEGRAMGFRSLKESLDTTTPGGRLIFHVFGALAEFETFYCRFHKSPAANVLTRQASTSSKFSPPTL
jgi:DNA invertase Pin-like site-specific DNA recombinase